MSWTVDHDSAGEQPRQHVVGDVEQVDACPHRRGEYGGLLPKRVAGSVHLDQAPGLGNLGKEVAALARDQQHDPPGRVEEGQLPEEALQVRPDPVVVQLACVNPEPPHCPAF